MGVGIGVWAPSEGIQFVSNVRIRGLEIFLLPNPIAQRLGCLRQCVTRGRRIDCRAPFDQRLLRGFHILARCRLIQVCGGFLPSRSLAIAFDLSEYDPRCDADYGDGGDSQYRVLRSALSLGVRLGFLDFLLQIRGDAMPHLLRLHLQGRQSLVGVVSGGFFVAEAYGDALENIAQILNRRA